MHNAVVIAAKAKERRKSPAANGHHRSVEEGINGCTEEMYSQTKEPRPRGKEKRARVAEDKRKQEKSGVGASELFEKATRKSSRALAREIVEINVAKGEDGDQREEQKEKEPDARQRKAKRLGRQWSSGHEGEVWRESPLQTRRKRGDRRTKESVWVGRLRQRAS